MPQNPAVSETSVANLALSLLRQTPITNLDDDQYRAAKILRKWFAGERDAVLRQYPWNFAEERAQLPNEITAPAFGGTYYYKVPSDYLSLRKVVGASRDRPARVVGNKRILTSLGPPLQIIYTARVINPMMWEPLFVRALALDLATMAGPELAKDERVPKDYAQRTREALEAAFPVDAQEGIEADESEADAGYSWAASFCQ